jgi:PhoH-like ATPase
MHLQRRHPGASGDPGLQGHQHAHQGPRARASQAQDYFNDKVLEDTDLLYTGMRELPADFWDSTWQGHRVLEEGRPHLYRSRARSVPELLVNQFVWQEGEKPLQPSSVRISGKTAEIETLTDYTHPKNNVWGITRATASRTSPSIC